ncbi:acid protease [Aureobasidium sp. EXF-8845]|nr:acid protease [Aureobasidium sp. EXF-8845]KAI4845569.1 acid protease [Aureobasidium sp. EXF-8846]
MKSTKVFPYLSLLFCCATAAKPHSNTVGLALMSSFGEKDGFMYYANVTVGTPGQLQTLLVDTGSANTYVFASNASFCKSHACDGGTFDLSKSSTSEIINPEAFEQNFMSKTVRFKGDYIRDVIQMNDLVISKLPLGLANIIKHPFEPYTGIMGLGYSKNINHKRGKKGLPPNFLEGLVQSGAIPLRLYSVYLNSLDRYGSLLFGGLDIDKYQGPLTTLNCLPWERGDKVDNFYLNYEEIKMYTSDGPSRTILRSTNDSKPGTVIDTGTPEWQLPVSAYLEIVKQAGAELLNEHYVRACSEVARGLANSTRFEITFSGNGNNTASLRLELADLFTPVTTTDGSAATDSMGRPMCLLRLAAADPHPPFLLMSNSVMRRGYWVFDLDNGQISLAQANLGANSSNVVQVEAGPEGLKKAAKSLRAETQLDEVDGQMPVSVAYELSTATNTVGYATGSESYPTPTGAVTQTPPKNHSWPRGGVNPHVRRAESAAATMVGSKVQGFLVLCIALIAAMVTMAV